MENYEEYYDDDEESDQENRTFTIVGCPFCNVFNTPGEFKHCEVCGLFLGCKNCPPSVHECTGPKTWYHEAANACLNLMVESGLIDDSKIEDQKAAVKIMLSAAQAIRIAYEAGQPNKDANLSDSA
jgi:hypothetical protein